MLLNARRGVAEVRVEARAGRHAAVRRVHPTVHHHQGLLLPVLGQSHGARVPEVPDQDLRQGHPGHPDRLIPLARRVHPGVREDRLMEEVRVTVAGRSEAMGVNAATARVPLNDGFWLASL